ncbi:hypothetical protein KSP39_PZI000793 [Platanthera zijinensis]|uniref:Uncharacterized protein n=1 Tax=Platanthera zijinensis TaxID=2320716 RepID=A0AAP0C1C4_9ASPA
MPLPVLAHSWGHELRPRPDISRAHREVEFFDGSSFNLSAEFVREYSLTADSKIKSVGGEKKKGPCKSGGDAFKSKRAKVVTEMLEETLFEKVVPQPCSEANILKVMQDALNQASLGDDQELPAPDILTTLATEGTSTRNADVIQTQCRAIARTQPHGPQAIVMACGSLHAIALSATDLCVSSARYIFIFNGEMFGSLLPSRMCQEQSEKHRLKFPHSSFDALSVLVWRSIQLISIRHFKNSAKRSLFESPRINCRRFFQKTRPYFIKETWLFLIPNSSPFIQYQHNHSSTMPNIPAILLGQFNAVMDQQKRTSL